jgi:hypothetical protein
VPGNARGFLNRKAMTRRDLVPLLNGLARDAEPLTEGRRATAAFDCFDRDWLHGCAHCHALGLKASISCGLFYH